MSDLGQRYHGVFEGDVVRDEMVLIVLYQGTDREKWVPGRITEVNQGLKEGSREVP
jgi:hypothetical protein